jgi:hypothetical protein
MNRTTQGEGFKSGYGDVVSGEMQLEQQGSSDYQQPMPPHIWKMNITTQGKEFNRIQRRHSQGRGG